MQPGLYHSTPPVSNHSSYFAANKAPWNPYCYNCAMTTAPDAKLTNPSSQPYFYLISPADYGALDRFGLTYSSQAQLTPGQLVRIPLARRSSLGVVVSRQDTPQFATKPLTDILDLPPLPAHLVDLALWMSNYYLASPKSVWQSLLPSDLTVSSRAGRAKPLPPLVLPSKDFQPTDEQHSVIKQVLDGHTTSYLLHGITGSGKTTVYLEAAKGIMTAGRSVIVLVPEISLTPQIEQQFKAVFADAVLTTHSGLTPAQRRSAWLQALNSRQPRIIIGPRSALFLPVTSPGLIIIDECHETTYKQEQQPRYSTDNVAAKLAALTGAKLLMGSATPNLTQVFLAKRGRTQLLELKNRPLQRIDPSIEVVDLRQHRSKSLLTPKLVEAITGTLSQHRQALLFLNRRGSASSLLCGDCGWVARCPNCAIALTFHADHMRLICHYCNYRATPPSVCPSPPDGCGSLNLRYIGGGTKRIETEVITTFSDANVVRLDRDSATPQFIHQTLQQLHDGQIDILIGTQMIAKGFDLPAVDTVGIVSADTALHLPDFTASERTFQLITQAAGRTGRGDRPGQVIIQSYTPDHPAIVAATRNDFASFADAELLQRRRFGYPPYIYLLKLTCQAATPPAAEAKAQTALEQLRSIQGLHVLGPAPALRQPSRNRFSTHLIVRSRRRSDLLLAARQMPSAHWTVDLDPISLL
jgi:primosomal protein N' (replication factor Y) (superfamily II helicase)